MFRALIFFIMLGTVTMLPATLPFMSTAQAAENKTISLSIPGMTCKFCPITIRKALNKVPGVSETQADFKTKSATVTFDPDKTSVEALIQATTNAGYPSTLKE